jgi:ubiquinone/menaquinone biosynthesis C-methylase UbiE
MNAESWSKHSTSYNGPSGDPLTLAMVKSAFEAIWFPKLDKLIIDKKRDLPLKVLALACGTGAEIEILCSRYDKSQVSILATDYADGMVQMTQNCVERLGKQDMVTTKVMDAMVSALQEV